MNRELQVLDVAVSVATDAVNELEAAGWDVMNIAAYWNPASETTEAARLVLHVERWTADEVAPATEVRVARSLPVEWERWADDVETWEQAVLSAT